MQDVVIDFETFYDKDYSLKSMMTAEYIHDKRFEVIGVSIKIGDSPTGWYTGDHEHLSEVLRLVHWEDKRLVAHNALFDGAILEWKFGLKPAKYFCTMMGSRPHVVPYTDSMSLSHVAEYLGVGKKGTEVDNHKGRHRSDFTPEQILRYASYCINDVELCHGVWLRLQDMLPPDEQDLVDLTIKKFTRPVLELDRAEISQRAMDLRARRDAILENVEQYSMTLTKLRSRPQFIAKLESLGVTIPDKDVANEDGTLRKKKGMSKKDPDFMQLLAHDKQEVRDLVAAKLEVSSSLEQSRLERFQRLYAAVPHHKLPVPLLYYGAHPGRFAGLDGLNLQNLPRPTAKDRGKAALRRAIRAPAGYVILAADYSNIEARIVATLANQKDLMEAFRRGDDIYSAFASKIYRRPINKAQDPIERFVGKTCILGLGYGMGGPKLQLTLATSDPVVVMNIKSAYNAVALYRDTYENIPKLWALLEQKVRDHVAAPSSLHAWKCLGFTRDRIVLPNGMPIMYPSAQSNWRGGIISGDRKLWGGMITENVTQALARIVVTRAELRLARAGLRAAHQAHDELIFCVPIEHEAVVRDAMMRIMIDPVPWLPQLPLAVEIHSGPTYGDCK